MQEAHGVRDLQQQRRGIVLGVGAVPLDAVEEVAAAEALGDEVVLVLPLDRLNQLDHAQVVQLRQDAHLRHHLALRLLQVSAQLRV